MNGQSADFDPNPIGASVHFSPDVVTKDDTFLTQGPWGLAWRI